MLNVEKIDVEEVKLGTDPKEVVRKAFGGSIPDVKHAEEIDYKSYRSFGIRIETEHPEKGGVFWRGVKDDSGLGLFGHPSKKVVSAEKIRSKWLEVLDAVKRRKQKEKEQEKSKNIERIVKDNGYENFKHFILNIKNKIIKGSERSLKEAEFDLNEILSSLSGSQKEEMKDLFK